MSSQFILRSRTAEAAVDPEAGGRVASLRVDGVDILRASGPRPTAWGSFPMVPWAGRLKDGTLTWGGHEYHFPTDAAPPHALHGLVVWRPWELVERTETSAVLTIELADPWPFGGRVFHSIELADGRLSTTLTVEAKGEPMPVIGGWHPWFVRRLVDAQGAAVGKELELDLQAGAMLSRGPDKLPDGSLTRPMPAGPWDDCFVELRAAPRLVWPGFLELAILSDAAFWVVFTEPADFICVEPQSGPPNGLNTGPSSIATRDQPFSLSMAIAWHRIG